MYFIVPAAPPWYVEMYGFEFFPDTLGESSRMANFDRLIGVDIFQNMYDRNPNVFGAMPSLHVGNAFSLVMGCIELKKKKFVIGFSLLTAGICFGAVYGNHHYILDLIAGFLVVLLAYCVVFKILGSEQLKILLEKYESVIS